MGPQNCGKRARFVRLQRGREPALNVKLICVIRALALRGRRAQRHLLMGGLLHLLMHRLLHLRLRRRCIALHEWFGLRPALCGL